MLQASYLLIALGWAFVPVYVASGVRYYLSLSLSLSLSLCIFHFRYIVINHTHKPHKEFSGYYIYLVTPAEVANKIYPC